MSAETADEGEDVLLEMRGEGEGRDPRSGGSVRRESGEGGEESGGGGDAREGGRGEGGAEESQEGGQEGPVRGAGCPGPAWKRQNRDTRGGGILGGAAIARQYLQYW